MRALIITVVSTFALLAGLTATAQTPDGQTPANEGVCDELIGLTPGLYGLCVAFCEAQDHADEPTPITEEDLAALGSQAPSGRILENYNKRKQPSDPVMPCIKVASCPCWSAEELSYVDGILPSGSLDGDLQCRDERPLLDNQFKDTLIIEGRGFFLLTERLFAQTWCRAFDRNLDDCDIPDGEVSQRACRYIDLQQSPFVIRRLFVPDTLTFEQWQACQAEIREANVLRCITQFPTN